ncbi:MAG: hypothetical protein ACUVX8_14840 [Candidatus Zipacnadales bacterium]
MPRAAMHRVTCGEWTTVLLWSAFMVGLTAGPYVVGEREAKGRYFCGLVSAVDDGNVYLQWIRQTSEGRWTLRNQYSADEGEGLSFSIFFLAVGRLARALGLRPPEAFGVVRALSSCFCLVAFFLLTTYFSPNPSFRYTALLLVSLSGGFGWLVDTACPTNLPLIQPIDYGPRWIYQPEAITFLALLVNPLFAFSLGLICLSFYCALRSFETARMRWALLTGLCLMVLANVHTYDIPAVHLTILAWLTMRLCSKRLAIGRGLALYTIMLLLTLPSGLWQWHVMQADPLYRAKADTPTLSGPYYNYALGYGVPWLLAVAGAVWIARTRSPEKGRLGHLLPWAVIANTVIYLPVPWQRKMAEGMHFPICLLAAVAIAYGVGERLNRQYPQPRAATPRLFAIVTVLVLISMGSNVLFYADCLRHIRLNNADLAHVMMPPIYLDPAEYAAIQELARRGKPDDVVMSSSMIGNHIPALSPCKVVAGHWGESVYLVPRPEGGLQRAPFESYALPVTLRFFSARVSETEKARWLLLFGVDYVFCGPLEERLYAASIREEGTGTPAPPRFAHMMLSRLPFLHKIHEGKNVSLFEVAPFHVLAEYARGTSPAGS